MKQSDSLIKALAFNNEVRIFVMTATQMVSEAQKRHDTWHTATAALGRTLIGTSLLSANLKGKDRLTVEISGQGPLGKIMADGDSQGNIRGFVDQPHVALPLNAMGKIDVKGAVGLPGTLTVSKRISNGEPFKGQVELVSGEIGEDFTYYMAASEQTPSAIGVSVLINTDETVQAAGGFMIQLMPNASEETILELEKRLNELEQFSGLIDQGNSPSDLLQILMGDTNIKILSEESIQFSCSCSKNNFGSRLVLLPPNDLREMIEQDHGAEVICHYCNERYLFSESELQAILAKAVEG